ncbi:MAG: hypothetical protein KC519_15245 [Anaerolineae bacterium]|nr:hypothetical protein [Anaerolineae bacterium]
MPINERIQPLIAQSFGLLLLGNRWRKTANSTGQTSGSLYVDYQWVAQIGGWWKQNVTIAYSQFGTGANKSLQGVLLVPRSYPHMEFLGTNPLRSVQIDDQIDLVAASLQSVNLFEESVDIVPGNERSPDISLFLYVRNGYREIHFDGGNIRDPSWLRLWDALFQTVTLLQAKYADPEIDTYLNRGPAGPAAPGFEKYVRRLHY